MKFTVDAKAFRTALEDVMGGGKYAQSGGVKSGILSEYVYLDMGTTGLDLWNGDGSYINKITLDITILDDSTRNAVVNIKTLLPFLKKLKEEIEITIYDNVLISTQDTDITLPRVTQHPHHEVIQRLLLMDLKLENELPQFNGVSFEGKFDLPVSVFKDAIERCELIGTGVYKIDWNVKNINELKISSSVTGVKEYITTVEVSNGFGDSATVCFTGPLHRFFDNGDITFYVKDEFPILIVGEDRLLVKVPHME